MSGIIIKNGRVIDPKNHINDVKDIYINGETITDIRDPGKPLTGFSADQIIDAVNLLICPGLVDLQNRLREPGYTQKGSISSETYAAVSGGITSLCYPPDTRPVIDSSAIIKQIRLLAENEGYCHVYPMAAMTKNLEGNELSEMYGLISSGCVGVCNALQPITNTQVLRRAFEYAASHNIKVYLHPQEPWLSRNGCAHEGMVSSRMGLAGIPVSAETIPLLRDLELIKQTGVKAHICQISSARGVEIIRHAKLQGLPITADVTAHHLHLTEMDIDCYNANAHILPPLRSIRDQQALIRGVLDNTIDAIVSDHQPHDADAKLAPFAETEPGISAAETFLALVYKFAREQNTSFAQVVNKITLNPAEILGINAGSLSPGDSADLFLFDPDHIWQVDREQLLSQGKNTPFHGWELSGKVIKTMVGGRLVYQMQSSHP